MAWYEGSHQTTQSLSSSADAAAAHFADPTAVVAATKGVEDATIDGQTVTLSLEEEDHGVMKFKGGYTFTIERDGHAVRWSTLKGNVDQSGVVTFEPDGDGCTMHYEETVKLDLDVPKLMAPMIKPVISALLANEIKDYLKRMTAAL